MLFVLAADIFLLPHYYSVGKGDVLHQTLLQYLVQNLYTNLPTYCFSAYL